MPFAADCLFFVSFFSLFFLFFPVCPAFPIFFYGMARYILLTMIKNRLFPDTYSGFAQRKKGSSIYIGVHIDESGWRTAEI